MCCLSKPIKKENDNKPCVNCIHEYNYSCYECLDNMQKEREKQLRDIYDKMKIAGFI